MAHCEDYGITYNMNWADILVHVSFEMNGVKARMDTEIQFMSNSGNNSIYYDMDRYKHFFQH